MFKEYFGIKWEFDHSEVDRIIEEHIKGRKAGYVVSLDGNNFAIGQISTEHMKILNSSIVNNCDSKWIPRIVNKIYGTRYDNYCGTDLFIDYVQRCKYRQFFLGSNRTILNGLQNTLTKYDLNILRMRFEELPFRNVEEFDYQGIANMINEDKPDIIWVSLGCPKQEQFMYRLLPFLNQGVMFGFGAIFNFYSGLAGVPKRAPKWMADLGLEFVYRIFSEPKKQIKRNLQIIKVLPGSIFKELKRKRAYLPS